MGDTKCPNCGSVDVGQWCSTKWTRCDECGTMWSDLPKLRFVPKRARPPEEFALPTWDGQAWDLTGGKCRVITVVAYSDHVKFLTMGGNWEILPRGRYFRVEPPTIVPEPAKDEDAEWLRAVFGPSAHWSIEDISRANRIADRLDRANRIADRLDAEIFPEPEIDEDAECWSSLNEAVAELAESVEKLAGRIADRLDKENAK